MRDVPALLPARAGRRISHKSVYRWTTQGCRGAVLRTVPLPGGRATTREWLMAFLQALESPRSEHPRRRPGRRLLRDRFAGQEPVNS